MENTFLLKHQKRKYWPILRTLSRGMFKSERVFDDEVDVIIDVADASALERNLYLTLQLLELGKPVVLALNMMDIVEKRGMEIDTHRLPELLGIPVIPVSARKRTGLDVLLHAAAHHKDCKDPECLIHHHKYISKHRHNCSTVSNRPLDCKIIFSLPKTSEKL